MADDEAAQIQLLYNCTSRLFGREFAVHINGTEQLIRAIGETINADTTDRARNLLTDCLNLNPPPPAGFIWWQKVLWACLFGAMLAVATTGNAIVMWIVLEMVLQNVGWNIYISTFLIMTIYLAPSSSRLTTVDNTDLTDIDLFPRSKATVMTLQVEHVHYQFERRVQNLLWEELDEGLTFANSSYLNGKFDLDSAHLENYNFLQMLYALSSGNSLYSLCTMELVNRNPPKNIKDLKGWINSNFNVTNDFIYEAVKHYSRIIHLREMDDFQSTNKLIFQVVESFSVMNDIFKQKDHKTLMWLLQSGFDNRNVKYEHIEGAWKNQDVSMLDVILKCMGVRYLNSRENMNSLLTNEAFLELLINTQSDSTILSAFDELFLFYDRMISICLKLDKLSVIKSLEVDYIDWDVVLDKNLLNEIVIKNKLNVLKAMIELGYPINSFDDDGLTILFRAVQLNNHLMLGAILQAGGKVNATNNCGKSLLHTAVERNLTFVAKRFIELGSHLEQKDCSGLTPIHTAILTNNETVIENLYKKYEERKPTLLIEILHFAASNGTKNALEVLIKSGLNVNDVNDKGLNALDFAIKSCKNENAIHLIKLGAKLSNSKNVTEYLKLNIKCNDINTLKYLLDNVISITDVIKIEKELLRLAIDNGNSDILKFLLEKGMNVNIKLSSGNSPIVEAVRKNRVGCLEVLLNAGSTLDPENHNGVTVHHSPILLHEGASQGSTEAVQWLLSKGRPVDERDRQGNTALMVGAARGQVGPVRVLLEAGADPNARNAAGSTVLVEAAKGGDLFCVRALLDHGADPRAGDSLLDQTALHWAAHFGHLSVVMELAERGAVLDRPNKIGDAALHLAADEGNYPIVMELLERGADLNLRNLKGQTPLSYAERGHHESIARALKIRGATL